MDIQSCVVSRERVVSLETQTRTSEAKTSALQQTLAHVNVSWIQFAGEKKTSVFLIFWDLQDDVNCFEIREN